jgi:NAD(P)-dependent dehydrogenase (short-subunit alcohol dehydrogenase family)
VSELRFDGRVAIVTGAGANPSLGRSYALLLAARGAKVVVNDIGVTEDDGIDPSRAQTVADEIVRAGGEAVADTHSVAEEDSAAAIVETAFERWGRVDVVINNAGHSRWAQIDELSSDDLRAVLGVHLLGTIWTTRAAWPHMRAAGYGRIVNIASVSFLGRARGAIYGAAKGGNLSLARGLAADGAEYGIKVNALVPRAATASVRSKVVDWESTELATWTPDQVAQTAAFLAHETCPVSGKCLASAGGRVWEIYLRETAGYLDPELSVEDVRDNFDRVLDRSDATDILDPTDPNAESVALKPYAEAGSQ